jgi:hypothetical protein
LHNKLYSETSSGLPSTWLSILLASINIKGLNWPCLNISTVEIAKKVIYSTSNDTCCSLGTKLNWINAERKLVFPLKCEETHSVALRR